MRLIVLLGLGLLACAGPGPRVTTPAPLPEPGEVEVSLYLIGDAGAPDAGSEPVLEALKNDIASRPGPERFVVFLGDNIYPSGLVDSGHPDRDEMERRIDDQVAVLLETEAAGAFVMGNHDWAKGSEAGWRRVLAQGARIDRYAPDAEALPKGGCPGPDYRDLGSHLRVVFVDTQWYLHGNSKPGPESDCGAGTVTDWWRAVAQVLAGAGSRKTVVAGHHPLLSAGPHGGNFTFRQHIFPLTEVVDWLYLPLPIIGSAYPFARENGITSQDIFGSRYRELIATLDSAFTDHPPLAYAAGHEHHLELLRGWSAEYLIVSGSGYYDHQSATMYLDSTIWTESVAGYFRLDVTRRGRFRLSAVAVDAAGRGTEAFGMWLD